MSQLANSIPVNPQEDLGFTLTPVDNRKDNDLGFTLTPLDTSVGSDSDEIKKSKLESAAEIALPIAGGIAGSFIPFVGPVVGPAIGAALGRGVEEIGEQFLKEDPARIVPRTLKEAVFEDTALGNVVKEGVLTFGGDKVFKALQPAFKSIGNKLPKIAEGSAKDGIESLRNFYDKVLEKIPGRSKDEFIRDVALKAEVTGIRPNVTKRVLERGPSKVLKSERLLDQDISQKTIDSVSRSFERIMDKQSKAFNQKVSPIFKANKDPININDLLSDLDSNIYQLFRPDDKGKLVPRALIDEKIGRDLKKVRSEIFEISDKATPKVLHKSKQFINDVLKKKAFRDNPRGQKILFDLHKNIRNKIEKAVTDYKKITNEFRSLFELEEQLGTKLSADQVENTLNQYFGKGRVQFRKNLDDLMSKNKNVKRIFDIALDERAAKDFVSMKQGPSKTFGVTGKNVLASFVRPGRTPLQEAKRFRRLERQGTLAPKRQIGLGGLRRAGIGALGTEALTIEQ